MRDNVTYADSLSVPFYMPKTPTREKLVGEIQKIIERG